MKTFPVTKRQWQIARLIILDHSTKEAAAALGITQHNVHGIMGRLYSKLGLNTKLQLVAWALREGRITLADLQAIPPKARYHGWHPPVGKTA